MEDYRQHVILECNRPRGEWIQCLDADDWIHEDKTRCQLEYLKGWENQEIVFYCDYERVFIDTDENIVDRQPNIIGNLNGEELIERFVDSRFSGGFSSSSTPAMYVDETEYFR